jgi:hypothetical protein
MERNDGRDPELRTQPDKIRGQSHPVVNVDDVWSQQGKEPADDPFG